MSIATFIKDPADVLDYQLNWADWLGAGTISTSAWTVPSGITQVTASNTTTTATIRLSGGTHGSDYEVLNHIVTANGQEADRSITIKVRHAEAGASSDATDRARAVSLLNDWAQADTAPTLTPSEIESILERHKVASTWTTSTAYGIGTRLLPPTRNGYWYRVVQPGTSQSAARTYTEWPTALGSQLGDGTSTPVLILEVAGPDHLFRSEPSDPASVNVYDVRGAARECWQLKMVKASHFMDAGDLAFSQVYEHCKQAMNHFQPIRWPVELMRS